MPKPKKTILADNNKPAKTLQQYIDGDHKASLDTLRILSNKDNFDKIVSDLKAAFQRDLNVEESCLEAGIHKDTYYAWLKASDEFASQIQKAKQRLKVHTKKLIAEKIMSHNDIETAKWWAERKLKSEFSLRVENTGADGNPIQTVTTINLENLSVEQLEALETAAQIINSSKNPE